MRIRKVSFQRAWVPFTDSTARARLVALGKAVEEEHDHHVRLMSEIGRLKKLSEARTCDIGTQRSDSTDSSRDQRSRVRSPLHYTTSTAMLRQKLATLTNSVTVSRKRSCEQQDKVLALRMRIRQSTTTAKRPESCARRISVNGNPEQISGTQQADRDWAGTAMQENLRLLSGVALAGR